MKPSDFTKKHPWDSVLKNMECEIVATNIMVILARTGDEFRRLSWEEYLEHRYKDGGFSPTEQSCFDAVINYCVSEEEAKRFCKDWANNS